MDGNKTVEGNITYPHVLLNPECERLRNKFKSQHKIDKSSDGISALFLWGMVNLTEKNKSKLFEVLIALLILLICKSTRCKHLK